MLHASEVQQWWDAANSLAAPLIALALVVAGIMGAFTLMINRFTALRRAFRKARITQRDEGWGGPGPDDARLAAELRKAERSSGVIEEWLRGRRDRP